MAEQPERPWQVFEKTDPQLFKLIESTNEFAFADGALPRKYKYLIAMTLDAAHGSIGGVRSLAQRAMEAGATKEEVSEALRVVYYIHGVGGVLIAAAPALRELFSSKP